MDNPATIEDVERRWGTLAGEDQRTRVQAWLDDAWLMVKAIPSLSERITAEDERMEGQTGDLRARTIKAIANAVIRVLKNPKGLWQVGIDDGTATFDRTLSSGELYIAAEDIADLSPKPMPLASSYSIPLGVPYWGV